MNVEIAAYVAEILQVEFDNLWGVAQQQTALRGIVAKNSFFLGLAKGYCNKIQALKKEHTSDISKALLVIEKKLTEAKAMAYPRLSSSKSSGRHCGASSALGEKMGKQLNINPGIKSSKTRGTAITYSGEAK